MNTSTIPPVSTVSPVPTSPSFTRRSFLTGASALAIATLVQGFVPGTSTASTVSAASKTAYTPEQIKWAQGVLLTNGFWLSGVDGVAGLTTQQATMAFQKANRARGLSVDGVLGPQTFTALKTAAPPRPGSASRLQNGVVIDKSQQLLFCMRGGNAVAAFNTSTGSGRSYDEVDPITGIRSRGVANTPEGMFKVEWQVYDPNYRSPLGKMPYPKFFGTGGYAFHGSDSVPAYPASHGCARISVPGIKHVWDAGLAPLGTPVQVIS